MPIQEPRCIAIWVAMGGSAGGLGGALPPMATQIAMMPWFLDMHGGYKRVEFLGGSDIRGG